MAVTANFALTPNVGRARLTTSNTDRTGAGTEDVDIYLAFTAGSNGARVDRINLLAAGTVAATVGAVIRVFHSSGSGANKRLYREWPVTVVTPSNTAVGWNNFTTSKIDSGLSLKAGEQLWVTCSVCNTTGNIFDAVIEGGDF